MGKNKRAKAESSDTDGTQHMPDFIYDSRPSYILKRDLEEALAQYAVDKEIIFESKPWREITLQNLLPQLK